jgi:hypothetical protein
MLYCIHLQSPDTSIFSYRNVSRQLNITNNFVNCIFEKIVAKASMMAHCTKRSTITKWEMQTAMQLCCHNNMWNRVTDGTKAITTS